MAGAKQGTRRCSVRINNIRRFKRNGIGRDFGNLNGLNNRSGFNSRAVSIRINPMFNTSQIPDNPGYVDFNEPTTAVMQQISPQNNLEHVKRRFNRRINNVKPINQNNRNEKWFREPNRLINRPITPPPLLPPMGYRNLRNIPIPRLGGNRGRPLPPPPLMNIRIAAPPIGSSRFGPQPIIPPLLSRIPMPPPVAPLVFRRGGPLIPPIMRRSPIQRTRPRPSNEGLQPIQRKKNIQSNGRTGKINRKRGGQNRKNIKKSVVSNTLNEITNQYPLDKPWVTEEIKNEFKKKEEIENKLKVNKIFKNLKEFKNQTKKFVNLYESARLEYIEKHPEQEKLMTDSNQEKAENQNVNSNKTSNVENIKNIFETQESNEKNDNNTDVNKLDDNNKKQNLSQNAIDKTQKQQKAIAVAAIKKNKPIKAAVNRSSGNAAVANRKPVTRVTRVRGRKFF